MTRFSRAISYTGIHRKVKREHGPASNWPCSCGCGRKAHGWALMHDSKSIYKQLLRGRLAVFSTDVDDYVPLAQSCHTKYDLGQPPVAL